MGLNAQGGNWQFVGMSSLINWRGTNWKNRLWTVGWMGTYMKIALHCWKQLTFLTATYLSLIHIHVTSFTAECPFGIYDLGYFSPICDCNYWSHNIHTFTQNHTHYYIKTKSTSIERIWYGWTLPPSGSCGSYIGRCSWLQECKAPCKIQRWAT